MVNIKCLGGGVEGVEGVEGGGGCGCEEEGVGGKAGAGSRTNEY